jgi:FkbM family methyltransferase
MNSYQRNLSELRKDRISGLVPREDYWREIQKQLQQLDSLAAILEQSKVSLIIRERKLITQITLQERVSIEMYLDTEDIRTVSFSVIADGEYEPFQSDLLFGLALQSKNFLDVGANVGFYSIAAAKFNPELNMKCFEPNQIVVQKLINNIALNEVFSQIEVFECGLGAENSKMSELFVPRFTGSAGGSLKNNHPEEGEPGSFSIKVRVLDEILAHSTDVIDLIKIDVEGYEKFVLAGCMSTISKHKPTIVIELLRKWMAPFNTSPQEVLVDLKSLGYRCYGISVNSLIEIQVIDELTQETNFIFVHPLKNQHLRLLLESVRSSET